ncbi:MAG: hypothetical protein A2Z98_04615 [Spirochaetes bacterium GWB1_27_13]|nr:MAG: hypothetical protein A2Z98_04615 [Spirochaetes bacterium GWB1_27_13]
MKKIVLVFMFVFVIFFAYSQQNLLKDYKDFCKLYVKTMNEFIDSLKPVKTSAEIIKAFDNFSKNASELEKKAVEIEKKYTDKDASLQILANDKEFAQLSEKISLVTNDYANEILKKIDLLQDEAVQLAMQKVNDEMEKLKITE